MDDKIGSLVIARKCSQCFSIGEEIIVEIVSIKRNLVTVKITAPIKLKVNRIDKRTEENGSNN